MTLAEIIAAAKDNAELRKQVVDYAKATDEGKAILEAFAKTEFEKNIKPEIAKVHKQYDDDIFEATGVRKSNDQKTYDFLKVQLKEFKALKDKGGSDNDVKIKELEKVIKDLNEGGEINGHWKKIYDEALDKWQETEKGLKGKIASRDEATVTSTISADLMGGRVDLKFKEGITEDVVKMLVAGVEPEVMNAAKVVDGKIVYHKPNGEPWLNDDYKPITSKEIWALKLKGVTTVNGESTQSKGGGADTNLKDSKIRIDGEGDNAKKTLVLDSASFSTKMEFTKVIEKSLRAEGIDVGSKEGDALADKAYQEYGVKDMDFQ